MVEHNNKIKTNLTTSPEEKPQAPLLIFDIETIPDIPLLYNKYEDQLNFSPSFNIYDHWNDYSLYEKISELSKETFPQTLFHGVLSICGVYVDPTTHYMMDGFKYTIPKVETYKEFKKAEKQLLIHFWEFSIKHQNFHEQWYTQVTKNYQINDYQKRKLKKIPVTFCGYNISSFDLLVIEQRSLINFITCPIKEYVKNLGNDSYRYKYAFDKVFDLINFVSNFDNRNARVSLEALSRSMGLGGKMKGMSGSLVAKEYFINSASQKIEDYCAIDVLISYGVLLAIQKFRGIIDEYQFKDCLKRFEQYLKKDGKPKSYSELAQESRDFFSYADEVKE